MIPATTSKFVIDSLKADDATQATFQESEMSIIDEESLPESRVLPKASTAQLMSSTENSAFEGPHSIELGDLSVLSNLSMDIILDKATHLDSDLTMADEFTELMISGGAKEPEIIIYYCAVVMSLSKYFRILDMLLAAVVVLYIQREKSPSLDRFLRRLITNFMVQFRMQSKAQPHAQSCAIFRHKANRLQIYHRVSRNDSMK